MSLLTDIRNNTSSVVNGKLNLAQAIISKGGTLSDYALVPSFNNLIDGVNSIPAASGAEPIGVLADGNISKGDVCTLKKVAGNIEVTERATFSSPYNTTTHAPVIANDIVFNYNQSTNYPRDDYGYSGHRTYVRSGKTYVVPSGEIRVRGSNMTSYNYDPITKRFAERAYSRNFLLGIDKDAQTMAIDVENGTSFHWSNYKFGDFAYNDNYAAHVEDNARIYKWDGSTFVSQGNIIKNTGLASGETFLNDFVRLGDGTLVTCCLYNDTTAIIQKLDYINETYSMPAEYAQISGVKSTGVDLLAYNTIISTVYKNILFGKNADFVMWLSSDNILHIADFDKTNIVTVERDLIFNDETSNANLGRTFGRFVLSGYNLFVEVTVDDVLSVEYYRYNPDTGSFNLIGKPSDTFSPAVAAGQMAYPIRDNDGDTITFLNALGGYTTYDIVEKVLGHQYIAKNCANTISTADNVDGYGIATQDIWDGFEGNASLILKK